MAAPATPGPSALPPPGLPPGISGSPTLTYPLPPLSLLHSWPQPQSNRPLAPAWCVNRAPRAGSGQAQNEPAGLSQSCISPEGPGRAQPLRQAHGDTAVAPHGEVAFPAPEGPWGQPHAGWASALAPEKVGFSPWAGKQWNRLQRASLGSNPSPPSGPRGLRTATQPLWASNTPTLQERDGGIN